MKTKETQGYFLSWDQSYPANAELIGGKAYNITRLHRFGFRVPAGGVLTTCAYEAFLNHNGLRELIRQASSKDCCPENLETLRERIMSGSFPPDIADAVSNGLSEAEIADAALAVRSSAAAEDSGRASFAGMHDTFLNVRSLDAVFKAIKACYASLWSLQAIVYRRKFGIKDKDVQMAVVLMAMAEARAAGVGFTCDPQTGRTDLLTVNANFGLGETVVRGTAEPDVYYLDTPAWTAVPQVKTIQIGLKEEQCLLQENGGVRFVKSASLEKQQVLSHVQIEELGLLMLRVFESLGEYEQHQDIEWAFDGHKFFLLQARPVTVLPRYTLPGQFAQRDVWSNGNYRDAVPMVLSPLHRRVMKNIIDTMQYTAFSKTGYTMPEGFQFSRFFNGRLYCNMGALQWAYYDSSGAMPQEFTVFWGGHQTAIEIPDQNPLKGLKGLRRILQGMKLAGVIKKTGQKAPLIFAQLSAELENLTEQEYAAASDAELICCYDQLGGIMDDFAGKFSFLSGAGSWPFLTLLRKLHRYMGDQCMLIINGLMVGIDYSGITSADQGYRLAELAEIARCDQDAAVYLSSEPFDSLAWQKRLPDQSRFKQSLQSFIKDYGHRSVYELDIINPRWQEDPSYLLDIVKCTLQTADSARRQREQKEKFDLAWQEVVNKIPAKKHKSIKNGIKAARKGAATREMTKSMLVQALLPYRQMALEVGKRLHNRGIIEEQADVFYCSWSDLVSILNGSWDGRGLKDLIAFRKTAQKEKEACQAPDVINGDEPVFKNAAILESGNCLRGVAAAAGRAAGTARLIHHPQEGSRLQPGEIMVAPSTDPGWTPLFLKASAVVMETGGFLSHGAIVAREYGIPTIVNIAGVMRIIKDGQSIVVDGDTGVVYLR